MNCTCAKQVTQIKYESVHSNTSAYLGFHLLRHRFSLDGLYKNGYIEIAYDKIVGKCTNILR